MIFLTKLIFIIIILNVNISINATETTNNKILFKIKNKVFTDIDFKERIKYIKISNELNTDKISSSEKKEIYEDYVSSLIFYEYFLEKKINYKKLNGEIETLFNKNILNKINNSDLNTIKIKKIKENFTIDVIRRKIIEDFLNSKRNELTEKTTVVDLIYNYNLSYLTTKEKNLNNIEIEKIKNREDFENLKKKLSNKKIDYLYKNQEIYENKVLSSKIKEIIRKNKKIYFEKKNKYFIIISLEKNLESYEGVFVKLISFNSSEAIKIENLNCSDIKKIIDVKKTIYKEYEYKKLNNKIKENLKSINDYIVIKENYNYNYIFLCELRYDEDVLNKINFDKKVEWLANKIQINFLNKYKKEYDFQKNE